MNGRHALLLPILLLSACGGRDGGTAPTAPPTPVPIPIPADTGLSAAARGYLTEIVNIMQANSVRRRVIDWPTFRAGVFAAAPRARTLADTRPAIRMALALLADGHSSYRAVDGAFIFVGLRNCTASGALPPGTLPADIGYVRVGSFSGTPVQAATFASGIQATIRSADRDSLIGWIVDLRGNGGGNMWPMIAGLGPVVGTGTLGAFIDPDGREALWGYRDGASWLGSNDLQRVASPYTLRRPNPRVAVLVDNGVASSGEATFLAFRRRPNTRSFGAPTCGLSTANSGFPLSDGALLNLTVSIMADRDRVQAGDQIAPDELVNGTTAVVDRAVEWLRTGRP